MIAMELSYSAPSGGGLSPAEIRAAVLASVADGDYRHVLLIPPDITRLHSGAGLLTNLYYHILTARGCVVDILPALGTHMPMTRAEIAAMYADIPYERFFHHDWRGTLATLGTVPGAWLDGLTQGLWREPIHVALSPRVLDTRYDLILSIGQVVPHEVAGMSNHAKNLFVGVGGGDMIGKTHMIGALCGMEHAMGRDHTPVRAIFDYAQAHFLRGLPIRFALTVTTAPAGKICTHGLFIGDTRSVFEQAVALSQRKNITFVQTGLRNCVVYLDPAEFRSTWLGNKAIYRTRMALARGARLLVLAPGIARFGEDAQVDFLIRKYGYCGRENILAQFKKPENGALRENMAAAAHLIHGSSDGRFQITYALNHAQSLHCPGFETCDFAAAARRYDPQTLRPGLQTLPDGETLYFIPNPALGLWVDKSRFGAILKEEAP